ncbi:hypothetical protein [Palleronia pelagia]|uniref:Uncharacterized protein n=1 Tax=Palleronia pelagia TaxID=387096 RepID=A0A1H8GN24_9RHOB|nr:hypothetical protein [Palleronia pelagia]SEN44887.1 hypothetical protein SAMN04488011_104129 [Palleronia pelagia]
MNSVTDPVVFDDFDSPDPDEAQDFSYSLCADVHVALRRAGPDLLICFGDTAPFDHVIDELEWSVLNVTSPSADALMRDEVVGFFDAMADGTLIDEFDRVLVLGTGELAGVALGYSVCAPMARVLILAPRGPLTDTERFPPSAATLAAAERVQVIYDPMDDDSATTARAISERGADLMPMRFGESTGVVTDLNRLDVMETLLEDAMDRQLSRLSFFRILRARRTRGPYLRRLNARLIQSDRAVLRAMTLRHIGTKLGRRRYLQEYEKLAQELTEAGVRIPEPRA